ncbi:DUF1993 domain-containing protein [Pseudopontixanthobacter vadosimaris]|uniref:DUF1993 domain-containing protein n=1 Tax=Pseudopontixanthobacter vadosimaris TaxID=2726450 RepID=UPI0014733F46|nr:DUF1993 domain-containing protein [Pseudopontixanthobacter vadosimaris]
MPLSLHEATVPSWLQILGSVKLLVDRAEAHCADAGLDAADLLHARLADDMAPFTYQVKSCATHSAGALEGVRKGAFSPDMTSPPDSFSGLRDVLAAAEQALEKVTPQDLEAIADKPMVFSIGEKYRLDFTVRDFLLSFSNPNFYFHATTAYAILRMKGLEIGKRDYLGGLRIQT